VSTTARGSDFEKYVFSYLEEELKAGRLFYQPKWSAIYHQKPYYSRDRRSSIVFDIAIEITFPGMKIPSALCLIECKDHNRKIQVDDVEAFFMKIQQIAPAAAKGIIVSRSSFQPAALEFAKSKRIGILRFPQRKWELARSMTARYAASFAATEEEIRKAFTEEKHEIPGPDCVCNVGDKFTYSLYDFIGAITSDVLGNARDWDVFVDSTLPALAAADTDGARWITICESADARRLEAREGVQTAMGSARYAQLALVWLEWLSGLPSREPPEEAADTSLRAYAQKLARASGMRQVTVPVRRRLRLQPVYHLVFLTRSEYGIWVFADALGKARQDWLKATGTLDDDSGPQLALPGLSKSDDMQYLIHTEKSRAQKIVEDNLRNLAQPGIQPFKLVNHASAVFGDAYGIATDATVFAAVLALEQSGKLVTVQKGNRIRDRIVRPA